MSFANKLWAEEGSIEEVGTSITTPAGTIENAEVVWAYKQFHDAALNVL